jgi:hypothetical protein
VIIAVKAGVEATSIQVLSWSWLPGRQRQGFAFLQRGAQRLEALGCVRLLELLIGLDRQDTQQERNVLVAVLEARKARARVQPGWRDQPDTGAGGIDHVIRTRRQCQREQEHEQPAHSSHEVDPFCAVGALARRQAVRPKR